MNYISLYVLTVIICVKCYNVLTLSKMSCFYNYRTTRARASAESHGNFIRIMEIMLIDIFEYIYIYIQRFLSIHTTINVLLAFISLQQQLYINNKKKKKKKNIIYIYIYIYYFLILYIIRKSRAPGPPPGAMILLINIKL